MPEEREEKTEKKTKEKPRKNPYVRAVKLFLLSLVMIVLPSLGYFGYERYMLFHGYKNVQNFCRSIREGDPAQPVLQLAKSKNIGMLHPLSARDTLTTRVRMTFFTYHMTPVTMERMFSVCELELRQGKIQSADYKRVSTSL